MNTPNQLTSLQVVGLPVVVLEKSPSPWVAPAVKFADPSLPQRRFEGKQHYPTSQPKPLPPERKAAWLARLRDPNEKQATGYLCGVNDDGTKERCCLGIYAEVCNIPSREVELHSSEKYKVVLMFEFPDARDFSFDRFAIEDKSLLAGDLKNEVEAASFLADLNDNGWTFLEIAALVERIY